MNAKYIVLDYVLHEKLTRLVLIFHSYAFFQRALTVAAVVMLVMMLCVARYPSHVSNGDKMLHPMVLAWLDGCFLHALDSINAFNNLGETRICFTRIIIF